MTLTKTLTLAAILGLSAVPAAYAQSATTLGGGGESRANGGAAGTDTSATGRSGSAGASSGEVGSRASSAAKGNDPSGTNGATNNRY